MELQNNLQLYYKIIARKVDVPMLCRSEAPVRMMMHRCSIFKVTASDRHMSGSRHSGVTAKHVENGQPYQGAYMYYVLYIWSRGRIYLGILGTLIPLGKF